MLAQHGRFLFSRFFRYLQQNTKKQINFLPGLGVIVQTRRYEKV